MKINSAIPSVGSAPDTGRSRGTAPAAPRPGAGSSERVDISSLSARMLEVGAANSPVNAQKVAEIKQAISEGHFQINPERIADGLLASVRDMLGHAKKPA